MIVVTDSPRERAWVVPVPLGDTEVGVEDDQAAGDISDILRGSAVGEYRYSGSVDLGLWWFVNPGPNAGFDADEVVLDPVDASVPSGANGS